MITQTELPSQTEQGAQGKVKHLESCVVRSLTHDLLDQAEKKLEEAIALLKQAQSSIKEEGVKSGWVESYPKKGKTLYNHGDSEGGRTARVYLPDHNVATTRREIANGRRLKKLERKTAELVDFTISLKEGIL